jgi:glycoside/pentoside/hexuronide:cation symporter, GPH family
MNEQAFQAPAGPVRLSLGYKVIWGVAAMGTSLISGTYAALLPIFYQDYLGLPAGWIGLASITYAAWNAINDPLFGYITDSTRTKMGRRIPYMRFTAPFLALTFILVWFAPQGAADPALFRWMLVTMLLYDTAYTIIGLVYNALLPEVSESDAERNGLQVSSALFGMLGFLLSFLIPDLFRPKAGEALFPLQLAMIGVAIFSMLLIIVTTLRVKERPEFHVVDQPLSLRKALSNTFSSRSFLILVAANFMSTLVIALVLGAVYYLADYVLQISTTVLLAYLYIPFVIGIPVTFWIRSRLGVVQTQQLMLSIAGAGLLLIAFAPTALIPLCVALAGFGLTGPQTLTNVLFAQVIDEDELRSGVRREGAFFGVNALITKPAQSIALFLSPWILEMTRFVTRESGGGFIMFDQPASAILGIKIIIGLVPGVALLLGALFLFRYPLRGAYLRDVEVRVLEMHAHKHAQLEAQISAGQPDLQPETNSYR